MERRTDENGDQTRLETKHEASESSAIADKLAIKIV